MAIEVEMKQNQRYDNVLFDFLSAGDEPSALRGTVIVREQEMFLEVEYPDDRPYSIRGKAQQGFWAGVHEGLSDDASVQAKWTRLDDIFIGTWLEDGIDYVFTFRLPHVGPRVGRPAHHQRSAE